MIEITEVRIKLMRDPEDRLRAFCSVTFNDSFVIRDLKIIDGTSGPFVAMPSRKLTAHCSKCGCKNHLRASYCNQCGTRQKQSPPPSNGESRTKHYADIAHPINSECRKLIQERIIAAYHEEKELATQPGYVPRFDDIMDYDDNATNATESETKISDATSNHPNNADGCDSSKPDEVANGSTHRRIDLPSSGAAAHHPSKEAPIRTNRNSATAGDSEFGSGVF